MSELRVVKEMEKESRARAFAELSELERKSKISICAQLLSNISDVHYSYPSEAISDFAESLLIHGRFDECLDLGDTETYYNMYAFCAGYEVETYFMLTDLKPDLEQKSFNVPRQFAYGKFEQHLIEAYGNMFSDLGSNTFRSSLYKYFAKYGDNSRIEKSTNRYISDLGSDDAYMTQSALVLKEIYGEEKVLNILDRIIADCSVSALDFIRLVMSEKDYTDYPLSWAINVV